MQLRSSKLRRGSFFRNRQISSKFAGSTTTNGSSAYTFLSLILPGNSRSRRPMMSFGFIYESAPLRVAAQRLSLCGSCLFFGHAGELVLLFHRLDRIGIAQLRWQ